MGNYYVPNIHYVIYIHINAPYITYLPLLTLPQKHSEIQTTTTTLELRSFCSKKAFFL